MSDVRIDGGSQFVSFSDSDYGPELQRGVEKQLAALQRNPNAPPLTIALPTRALETVTAALQLHQHGRKLSLHAPDYLHVERDCLTGRNVITPQSVAMWSAVDNVPVLQGCLYDAGLWLESESGPSLTEAFERGWRVLGLHIRCDFVGFPLYIDDFQYFTGRAKRENYCSAKGKLQTIEIGLPEDRSTPSKSKRRKVAHRTNIIAKSDLWRRRGVDPRDAHDANVAFAFGWNGDDDKTEVEHQLYGKALVRTRDGKRLDLRDPKNLAHPDVLAELWVHLNTVRRMHLGDDARPSRCTIDPRSVAVLEAAGVRAPVRISERRHSPERDRTRVIARETQKAREHLRRLAFLKGVDLRDAVAVAHFAADLMRSAPPTLAEHAATRARYALIEPECASTASSTPESGAGSGLSRVGRAGARPEPFPKPGARSEAASPEPGARAGISEPAPALERSEGQAA